MQIEVGKFYRTRDGRKAGPVVARNQVNYDGPFLIDGLWNYDDDGKVSSLPEHRDDLVAEWTEATPAEPASEIETPKIWRDMSDAEKGALLLAHHEGAEIEWLDKGIWVEAAPNWVSTVAYRARPVPKQPVVETVTLGGACNGFWSFGGLNFAGDTASITFDVIDGKPDWSTLRGEDLA